MDQAVHRCWGVAFAGALSVVALLFSWTAGLHRFNLDAGLTYPEILKQDANWTSSGEGEAATATAASWGRTCNRLIYNRIAKAGSSSMKMLIEGLAKKNGFRSYSSRHSLSTASVGRKAYKAMCNEMGWTRNRCPRRSVAQTKRDLYVNHMRFLDYEQLAKEEEEEEEQMSSKRRESLLAGGHRRCKPLFMNIARDPISRCVSAYYYRMVSPTRSKAEAALLEARLDINECVAVTLGGKRRSNIDPELYESCLHPCLSGRLYGWFCGYHKECRRGDDAAYRRARANVEKHYVTVGIVEMWNESVAVLERLLPSYFGGATDLLPKIANQKVTQGKGAFYTMPDAQTLRYLTAEFAKDSAFYQWLSARLKKQYAERNELEPYTCEA